MMQSNLNTAAEKTEITEKSDRYLKFAFSVEDLYPEVLARKWTLSISSNLTTNEKVRFNELRKLMAGISSTVLSDRLLELDREDLISKKIYPELPPRVEYSLTVKLRNFHLEDDLHLIENALADEFSFLFYVGLLRENNHKASDYPLTTGFIRPSPNLVYPKDFLIQIVASDDQIRNRLREWITESTNYQKLALEKMDQICLQ